MFEMRYPKKMRSNIESATSYTKKATTINKKTNQKTHVKNINRLLKIWKTHAQQQIQKKKWKKNELVAQC
jgi:hypothetical protein